MKTPLDIYIEELKLHPTFQTFELIEIVEVLAKNNYLCRNNYLALHYLKAMNEVHGEKYSLKRYFDLSNLLNDITILDNHTKEQLKLMII